MFHRPPAMCDLASLDEAEGNAPEERPETWACSNSATTATTGSSTADRFSHEPTVTDTDTTATADNHNGKNTTVTWLEEFFGSVNGMFPTCVKGGKAEGRPSKEAAGVNEEDWQRLEARTRVKFSPHVRAHSVPTKRKLYPTARDAAGHLFSKKKLLQGRREMSKKPGRQNWNKLLNKVRDVAAMARRKATAMARRNTIMARRRAVMARREAVIARRKAVIARREAAIVARREAEAVIRREAAARARHEAADVTTRRAPWLHVKAWSDATIEIFGFLTAWLFLW